MGGGFKEHKKEILGAAALAGLGIATGGFGLAAAPALAGAAGAGAAGAAGATAAGIGGGTAAAGMAGMGAASPMAAGLLAGAEATPFITEGIAAAAGAPGMAGVIPGGTAGLFGPAGATLADSVAPMAAGIGAPPTPTFMDKAKAVMDKLSPAMKMMQAGQQEQQPPPPSPQQTNRGPAEPMALPNLGGMPAGLYAGADQMERQRLAMLRAMGIA